ncbi:MAG: FMN-binding protein, partial [Bacteroidota bacterium]
GDIYAYCSINSSTSTISKVIFDLPNETYYDFSSRDNLSKEFNKLNEFRLDSTILILRLDSSTNKIITHDLTIDAVTGATITNSGVVDMFNKGLKEFQLSFVLPAPAPSPNMPDENND